MRTEDCIEHRSNRYLQIRQDYLDLFDNDLCSALLLWEFEYLTNAEIDRQRTAREDGPPWIKVSVERLVAELFDRFKERSIRERLAFFRDNNLLMVESGTGGRLNRYLLQCDRINALLASRSRLNFAERGEEPTPNGGEADCNGCSQQNGENDGAGCKAGCKADCNGCSLPNKEVESRNIEKYPIPLPPSPFSKEQLNDPIEDFLVNAWSRTRRVRLKLGRKSDAATVERCRALDAAYPNGEFRQAALLFLESDSNYLRQFKWPIAVFLSQVQDWIDRASDALSDAPPRLPDRASAIAGGGEVVGDHPAPTNAPSPVSASPAPSLPGACEAWNQIVVDGEPVESWTRQDAPLHRALSDPDFQAALPRVLEMAQRVCSAGGDWKPTFRWLLRTDRDGIVNWHKLLTEGKNWARPRSAKSGRLDPAYEAYLDSLMESTNEPNPAEHQTR